MTDTTRAAGRCPFCLVVDRTDPRPLRAESSHVVAFADAFPSAPGHLLVVPRRHVARLSDLDADERAQLWQVALGLIDRQEDPDAFTVGVNDGTAAGQTVPHVHLHVIPRHHGDTDDPRGGVRLVLGDTARYWQGR